MADINELFGEESSSLDQLVDPAVQAPQSFPHSAVRNRAATTAFLTDTPEKAVENYQTMMVEGQYGQDGTVKTLQEGVVAQTQQQDLKGMLSLLSDPSVGIAQKEAAIKGFKNNAALKDTPSILASNAIIAPSKGENIEQENVRLTTADMLEELNAERQKTQGLVNAVLSDRTGNMALGAVEALLTPGSQGLASINIGSGMGKKWTSIIKDALLPGSDVAATREKLARMTPAQRIEFSTQLKDSISNNSGLLLSTDNQYVVMERMNNIFGDDYNDTDKWLDNIGNLLDIVGIGFAVRGPTRFARAAERVSDATASVGRVEPTMAPTQGAAAVNAVSGPVGPVRAMPEARVASNAGELADVERRYAEASSNVQTRLDPGEVSSLRQESAQVQRSLDELKKINVRDRAKELQADGMKFKDAQAQAKKEISERQADLEGRQTAINQRLDLNASSEAAQSELLKLEERMNALRKDGSTQPAQLNPLADALSRIQMNSIVKTENPASPGSILMQTNPERARGSYAAAFMAGDDQVSEAIFGATKADVIAAHNFPQAATESGRITSRPMDVNRTIREGLISEIEDISKDAGGIQFTPKELASARAAIVHDFQSANGLTVNDSMSSFALNGDNIRISAVYGTPEGGWLRAEDAVEQAMYALRKYGITPDEVKVMKKEGLDHVEVDLNSVRGQDGDYLIRIDTDKTIEAADVEQFDSLTVKRNIFDFIPKVTPDSWGSAQRWVFDASSALHPTITGAAINAADRTALLEKSMLQYASFFSDGYNKLDKARKTKMDDYIKEANFKGIKYDRIDLKARGFNDGEIDTLGDWKDFWDGHYYLENLDVVRTLRRDGYQSFDNGNTQLVAKPVAKNINLARVYDPAVDRMVTLSKQEMDDLYANGGTIAGLRRPTDIVGELAEQMIVRNTPNEYLKGFRDSDRVLNYRDGYFQLTYKAPKFVEEVVRHPNGSVAYTKAVAVAGDRKEADFFAKRQAASTGAEYRVRGDERAISRDSDAYWDINSVNGRIAQRHRGKLLEDSAGVNHLGDTSFIENPVNSAVRAAMSVSGRTVNRPMLDAAKQRFIEQYKDVLPQNEFGLPRFPNKSGEIAQKGVLSTKELADARTTFEYIRYLEQGYINSVDNVVKATFNALGEGFSKLGLTKLERGALAASEVSPTGVMKSGVFNAYIASNPLRQWIVQTHQVVRSQAYNPIGWANGGVLKYATGYMANISTLTKPGKDVQEFIDFVKGTGMLDAIDKNNLVRGTLSDAAGRTNPILRTVNSPLKLARQVGFDVGEMGNIIGHSAAVYEKYKRSGKDITDSAVRAQMHSEIRAITWDMNFAGDMPYNQNWAAMALQFMQVPHKAMLQMTNRRIDRVTRFRMVMADMLLWGAPLGIASSMLPGDILPDNPQIREAIVSGVESWALNRLLTSLDDEPTSVDFTSLAPYEMGGWAEFFKAIWSDGGMSKIIANAPAGQLFFKDGGRLGEAVQMAGRYFGVVDNDLGTPVELLDVANEIAKISSGWNNWQKGSAMLVLGQARDAQGRMTDEQVSQFEAYAQMLGFTTSDTRDFYETSIKLAKDSKDHQDKAITDAKEVLRLYQTMNPENKDSHDRILKVTGVILKKYQNDPIAQGIMQKEFDKALSDPQSNLIGRIMKNIALPNVADLPDTIRKAPLSDENKQQLMQVVDDMKKLRTQDYYKED